METRRPSGTYVCREFSPKLLNPLLYGMILQSQESYDELIRLRKVVELGTLMPLSEREDFDRTALQTALENFEEACREECVLSCCLKPFGTPWTVARRDPLSTRFSAAWVVISSSRGSS